MKTAIFGLGFLFVSLAQAQEINLPQNLQTHRIHNCTFWSYQNGGYSCSGYPSQVVVPDAYSTVNLINSLDARIKALEAKVQELEIKNNN